MENIETGKTEKGPSSLERRYNIKGKPNQAKTSLLGFQVETKRYNNILIVRTLHP